MRRLLAFTALLFVACSHQENRSSFSNDEAPPAPSAPAAPEAPATTTIANATKANAATTAEAPPVDAGGRGVVCGSGSSRTIESAELYQARAQGSTEFVEIDSTHDAQVEHMTYLIAAHFQTPGGPSLKQARRTVKTRIEKMLAKVQFIPAGTRLPVSADVPAEKVAADCRQVQIASFRSDGVTQVDRDYWQALPSVHQTSVLIRRLVYEESQRLGSIDSDLVKKLTAKLLSKEGVRPRADGIPRDSNLYRTCRIRRGKSNAGVFYAFEGSGLQDVEMVFHNVTGLSTVFRTSLTIPFISVDALPSADGETSRVQTGANIQVDDEPSGVEAKLTWNESGPGHLKLVEKASQKTIGDYYFSCQGPHLTLTVDGLIRTPADPPPAAQPEQP